MIASLVAEAGSSGPLSREYRLVPESPTLGTLTVTSEPPDADVFLDGSPKPAGPEDLIVLKPLPARNERSYSLKKAE